MIERTKQPEKLSSQMKKRAEAVITPNPIYDGNFGAVISTGSTLLDLSISGGRVRGGGIPGGILVEVFGPSGSGKTVLLSEIAGAVQRQGGEIRFDDPEARLDGPFAKMFGLIITKDNYARPNTLAEVFNAVREWKPAPQGVIHGSFADSLAAFTTEEEQNDNDPYGMRKSKEASKELRLTCREIANKNYLMVCSNQIRDVIGATGGQEKTKSPGGRAWEFYPSLRLRFSNVRKLDKEAKIAGKDQKRIIGIRTDVYVYKSSIWKPFHSAPITILFDYGIDDIRESLQYIKDNTLNTTYTLGGENLSNDMEKAIKIIEKDGLENQLREETISLWESIEAKYAQDRKPKR
jgi:recombination protein RecA